MSTSIQSRPTDNSKMVLAIAGKAVLALIAAMGTIGAALVASPQLWNFLFGEAAATVKKMSIDGTVVSGDASLATRGLNVYLLPAGKVLETQTDDSGRFVFDDVPDGEYSIIFRETSKGLSGKGVLDWAAGETQTLHGSVKFRKRTKGDGK